MLANLTGHDITIVDKYGNPTRVIAPCEIEEPLRADVSIRRMGKVDGVRLTKIHYVSNITKRKMMELFMNYEGIIVSKITAECLRELGYTENVYITGRKFYLHGKMIGVRELCVL